MTMTPEAFAGGMALLQEIYPKHLSEKGVETYGDVCGHLSDDVWHAAIQRVMETNTFFPVPAEILKAANDIAATAHGIATPDAAWRRVHGVARGWGEGKSVRGEFDPLTWDAVQAIGGIRAVALADDGFDISRLQREFVSAYTKRFQQAAQVATELPLAEPTMPVLSNGVRR